MDEHKPATEIEIPEFNFDPVYANNTRFEPSVWDLKVLFGELRRHTDKSVVQWHTAITMPWMQAKIFEYWLRVNLLLHQLENGSIQIHPNVLPPQPVLPSGELENDPIAKAQYEQSLKIYADVFGD